MTITAYGPTGQTIQLPDDSVHPELATAIQTAIDTHHAVNHARQARADKKQIKAAEDTANQAWTDLLNTANSQATQWTAHIDAGLRTAVADLHDHLAAARAAATRAAHLLAARQVAAGPRPWEMNTSGVPQTEDSKRASLIAASLQQLLDLPATTEHR